MHITNIFQLKINFDDDIDIFDIIEKKYHLDIDSNNYVRLNIVSVSVSISMFLSNIVEPLVFT